jgi:hypothetical protein
MEMSEEVKQRVEHLRDITDADTMSEVVRRALALYDYIWSEKLNGSVPILRDKNGKDRELVIL